MSDPDVVVIGGGPAALAVGYFLRRAGLAFEILDEGATPGGLGRRSARDEVIASLEACGRRYDLPVRRPVRVSGVFRDGDRLRVATSDGNRHARAVVSATEAAPWIPDIPGRALFGGIQIHSCAYVGPRELAGKRVVVVGDAEPAARIAAELAELAWVSWATLRAPIATPDEVDRPGLRRVRVFWRFTEDTVVWQDGREEWVDAIVWCTGFRRTLRHLEPLGINDPDGRVLLEGSRSVAEPRLWLVGYDDRTDAASATLIGVARSARGTVDEIAAALAG